MSAPFVVWLVVGLVSAAALLAVLIALVRHLKLLAHTLGRFRDEVAPLAAETAEEGARAGERASGLQGPGLRAGRDRGRPRRRG